MAEEKNINQVIKKETMEPIVNALFSFRLSNSTKMLERVNPDPIMAEVAQLFVETGFNYLKSFQREEITLSHQRTIEEAIDLANYLQRQRK
jgi:hypothetical protein